MSTTTIEPPVENEAAAKADETNVIALRPRKGRKDSTAAADGVSASVLDTHVEAILFVSTTPVAVEVIADAASCEIDEAQDALVRLMTRYSEGASGIVLERVAGGWAFRAADASRDVLMRMFEPQADARLSPASLETLAIVAYLQPISRPDVAKIRGVAADAAISGLLERGFVDEAGRSESGAVMFRTTALFERAFGISSLASLPEIDGFGPGPEEVAKLRQQLEQMASARVD